MLVLYRSNTRMLTNGGLTNFEQWAAQYGGKGESAEAKAQQVHKDVLPKQPSPHIKHRRSAERAEGKYIHLKPHCLVGFQA